VYTEAHPRRSLDSSSSLALAPCPLSPNSNGITSFADPHPLTLLESYRSKIIEGRGASNYQPRSFISCSLSYCPPKPLRINTCKSVSKQSTLTTFRMNTYEKPRGEGVLLFTRNPARGSYQACPPRTARAVIPAPYFQPSTFDFQPPLKTLPFALYDKSVKIRMHAYDKR
jgi:hypothetical protein